MKNILYRKTRRGFTLIELILVLALLSIIIITVFSFQIFNIKIYNKSDKLSQIQFDLRMASDYITSTVRNSNDISISNSALDDHIDISLLQDKYNFVKSVEFTIHKQQEDAYFISYSLTGSDFNGENSYKLESEVFIQNVSNLADSELSDGPSGYLYFTK